MKNLSILALLMAAAVVDSAPVAAGVNHGRRVARRWCVSCRLVAVNQLKR
jgi:hypothetical protein